MPANASLFEFLAEEKNLAADSALLEALSGSDEPTAHRIVLTLLARKKRRGLRGLVEHYHQLPESIRHRLARQAKALAGALREASQGKSDQTLANVIEIILAGRLYRSAYLLDLALRHREPHVRETAATALYRLCEELQRPPACSEQDLQPAEGETDDEFIARRFNLLHEVQEDHRQMAAALDSAMTSFHVHHHPRTLESAMWLVEDLDARFWAQLTAPNSKIARAAINLIEDAGDPRLVPFVMLATRHGSFRTHVACLFEVPLGSDFLDAWFRQGWRLIQPKLKRGMAAIKDALCINEADPHLISLSPDAQRHIPRWILTTGVPEERKRVALRELLIGGQITGQRAALIALLRLKDEQATSLLRQVAGQSAPELAFIARLELARRQPDEYPPHILLELLRAQGQPGMEMTAPPSSITPPEQPAEALAFNEFWTHFDQYSSSDRAFRAKTLFAKYPACVDLLGERLKSGSVHDRVRCLTIIAAAELAEAFQDDLHHLSHDPDPGIRSTAIAAIGPLADAASRHIIRNALVDGDTRVQANAVEAIGECPDEREREELILKLASPNNRVRANAIRVLLKLGVREAAQTLMHMLNHQSRAQRISALWLIDQLGLRTIMNRVAQLADADPDVNVRARAGVLSDRLRASTTPAGSPEEVSA